MKPSELRRAKQYVSVVVVGLITAVSVAALQPSERERSKYRPGDCVRTPVYDLRDLERFETPPAASEILMIADVGERKYRVRGWGGGGFASRGIVVSSERGSSYPHWYVDNGYEVVDFSRLDNKKEFMPIPCPEQGEEPAEEVASSTFVSDKDGNTFIFTVRAEP